MASENKLFHESWHRIAKQHICLRSNLRVHRQIYRSRKWYIVQDPFSNEYYRLTPQLYQFVCHLSLKTTVEDTWKKVMNSDPENAPGQG